MNRPLKVLVVEDNELAQNAMKLFLETDQAIHAEVVGTVRKAMEQMERVQYSVVLLDLNLPDSVELQGMLAIHSRHPSIPIVVITGLGRALEARAMQEGAQDYLEKPSTAEELIDAVRKAVIRNQTCLDLHQQFADLRRSQQGTAEAIKEFETLKSLKEQCNP